MVVPNHIHTRHTPICIIFLMAVQIRELWLFTLILLPAYTWIPSLVFQTMDAWLRSISPYIPICIPPRIPFLQNTSATEKRSFLERHHRIQPNLNFFMVMEEWTLPKTPSAISTLVREYMWRL